MTTVKDMLEADCATVPDPMVGEEKLFRTLLTVTELLIALVNACALLMLVVGRASPTKSRERLTTSIFFVCIVRALG